MGDLQAWSSRLFVPFFGVWRASAGAAAEQF
jgi:hypothetical protein